MIPWKSGFANPRTQKYERRRQKVLTIRILVRWLLGWWLNLYGYLAGYGHCAYCKCTWNWVHGFSIPYSGNKSMFPVCDLCFRSLNSLEVIRHADALIEVWARSTNDDNGMPISDVRRNVAQAVRFLKDEISGPPFEAYWPQKVAQTIKPSG